MTASKRGPQRAALAVCLLTLFVAAACRTVWAPPSPSIRLAEPALRFDRLFERTGGGWTGGDGTLSIALPDGRTVWLFGDSFLGTVSPAGRRPPDTPFIHNCLVVQRGENLKTLYRFIDGEPAAFFTPLVEAHWYWPGHGTVEADQLKIFLHRFELREPRLWGWRWIGTDIATLSLPSLSLCSIAPAPAATRVMYGVFVLNTQAYTYIYGTADLRRPKAAHLARSAAGQVQGPWQYFTGDGWSDRPEASRPVLSGVSTQYAVLQAAGGFYLFTMDGRIPFSNHIVVYRAPYPWGPWKGPLSVYRAPEAHEAIAAYNPFVHTQFTSNSRVLVSYNLNAVINPAALYWDAAIYRPRFIRVDMDETARLFRAGSP